MERNFNHSRPFLRRFWGISSRKKFRQAALHHSKHNDTLSNYIERKERCQAFLKAK
ncbi:MAG: hypothetical protein IJX75_03810 [Clostridia bacterium]|nr:hypothetical protein [Clostridia bacterium]